MRVQVVRVLVSRGLVVACVLACLLCLIRGVAVEPVIVDNEKWGNIVIVVAEKTRLMMMLT